MGCSFFMCVDILTWGNPKNMGIALVFNKIFTFSNAGILYQADMWWWWVWDPRSTENGSLYCRSIQVKFINAQEHSIWQLGKWKIFGNYVFCDFFAPYLQPWRISVMKMSRCRLCDPKHFWWPSTNFNPLSRQKNPSQFFHTKAQSCSKFRLFCFFPKSFMISSL